MHAESTAPRQRILVILNPVSGNAAPADVRLALDELLSDAADLAIHETSPNEALRPVVQQALADGCTLVMACGGDGTVSQVANELVGTDVPLCILPLGTANVLARELGIPQDVRGAIELAAGGAQVRKLDLMRARDRHYLLQIGIGLDSLMIKDTGRQAKRLFGRLAYMTTLIGKLFGYESQRFTILVDGRRMRPRAWQVLIANAGTLGVPPFRWGPGIEPGDGELDLCIFNVRRPLDYGRVIYRFMTGSTKPAPNITYERIRQRVVIITDAPLPIQADGEIIGESPLQIEVVPQGIGVLVPSEEPPPLHLRLLGRHTGIMEEQQPAPVNASDTAAFQQTKDTLREAVALIQTPEHADLVIDELVKVTEGVKERDVAAQQPAPPSAATAAEAIAKAGEAPPDEKPQQVFAEAAAQLALAKDDDEALLGAAMQRALNPEAVAGKPMPTQHERDLLQQALIKRLRPLQAFDASLFLRINHLPHPPAANTAMYALTTVMNRGDAWVAGLLLASLFGSQRARNALIDVVPALWLTTATVEFPIKRTFRRKRPFIALVRAIVVGKKPSHYSFPSGHSAAAFAGAWLLSRQFPFLRPVFYLVAALTGFSRVYLGAHYPGDVLSGAVSGSVLAVVFRAAVAWLVRRARALW